LYFNSITELEIPASIESIGAQAFNFNSLATVTFAGDAPGEFTPANDQSGGFQDGSFGDPEPLTVYYQWRFDERKGGGFTEPRWQGYTTRTQRPTRTVSFDMNGHGEPIAAQEVL